MGCPSRYYTRALQCFSHALAFNENKKLAKELSEEKSDERLEKYILDKKETISEKEFYYNAGRATEFVLNEADEEGCDAFNAACGGLNMFDIFIGIEEDED